MGRLTEAQIGTALEILRVAQCQLLKASTDDYVRAAEFIFKNRLLFYPGVAIEELEAGRRALQDEKEGGG